MSSPADVYQHSANRYRKQKRNHVTVYVFLAGVHASGIKLSPIISILQGSCGAWRDSALVYRALTSLLPKHNPGYAAASTYTCIPNANTAVTERQGMRLKLAMLSEVSLQCQTSYISCRKQYVDIVFQGKPGYMLHVFMHPAPWNYE